jgi:FkbM family methyltransferase
MKTFIEYCLKKIGYEMHPFRPNAFESQQKLLAGIDSPVILDLGAHHGETVEAYKAVFPKAKIFSFEPFPESFEILKQRAGQTDGVKLVPLAVSDSSDKRTFFVNDADSTNSLLPRPSDSRRYFPKHAGPKTQIEIETITIDDFLNKEGIDHVDILKMDIQGGELLALKGFNKGLREQITSIIYTEVMFVPHYEGGVMFHQLSEYCVKRGYTLWNIFELSFARNGQLRGGNALFVNENIRREVIDAYDDEP